MRVVLLAALCTGALLAQSPSKEARDALSRADYKRAEELYRSMLRDSPESPEVLNNLGIALHFQGKSSEAVRVLEKVLKVKEIPPALALLGSDLCTVRQFDRAADVLRRAKRYSADLDVMNVLGPCYLEAGEPLDAVLVYENLVASAVSPVDENAANLTKAYFRASRYFLAQLEKAPSSREYLHAIEQARQNSSPDAREAFGTAMQQAPYLRPGMSISEMAAFLPQHKTDAPLLYVLGVVCGEQAMTAFLACEKQYENSAAVRRLYAEMLRSQGRLDAAIAEYQSIPDSYYDLAMLYRESGDWDKAFENFRQQQNAHPQDERAVAGASESLLHIGRFADLKQYLQGIVEAPNAPEWALLDVSKAEQEIGNVSGAIHYLEIAARQYPSNQVVHYRLGHLYKLSNRPEFAAQEYRKVEQLKRTPK
jgi:tetratricopeptide (TPR) repeat protein